MRSQSAGSLTSIVPRSAIYQGTIRHQRKIPVINQFEYAIFMMLLDLDELPELFDPYWFWSARKPNICSFNNKDHLKNLLKNTQDFKKSVVDLVKEHKNITLSGPIKLLTHLRYWGYGFNPVSFYYCYDALGENIEVIVAEVNNTPWREQHCYIMSKEESVADDFNHQRYFFPKGFHVSPLMSMDFQYEWSFTMPSEKLWVHMKNWQNEKEYFNATLALTRKEITHESLAAILLKHPFMTAKVITGIYWQALRTRLKGAHFYPHP